MLVLVFVAIFLFGSAFSSKPNIMYRYCLALLFTVTAFRHPALSGLDMLEYYDVFSEVPKLYNITNYTSGFQFGYITFNSLAKTLFGSFIGFQIFYVAICMLLLHSIIKLLDLSGSEKCLFLFGFFCYDFLWYFWETLRQNMADLLFFFLIIYYYKNKVSMSKIRKYVYFVLLVFVPYLFHSSAIVLYCFFPFLFLRDRLNSPMNRFVWVCIASVVIYILSSSIFSGLDTYLSIFDDRYCVYAEYIGTGTNILNMVFRLVIFYLFCRTYKENEYIHKKFILDACTVFILIGSMSQGVAGRLSEYFAFGFYVPMAFIDKYKSLYRPIVPLFLVAMLVIFIRKAYTTDDGLTTHYYLFFQEIDNLPPKFKFLWQGLSIY